MPTAAGSQAEADARFWAKVDRASDCWAWIGALTTAGYGSLKRGGVVYYAHRISWEMHHGPVPAGQVVCHLCDNRRCVRPDHMFLGSQHDNLRDAAAKGRMERGEARHSARLTVKTVAEIRNRYARGMAPQQVLAADYGVSQMAISKVVRRETWRHVP